MNNTFQKEDAQQLIDDYVLAILNRYGYKEIVEPSLKTDENPMNAFPVKIEDLTWDQINNILFMKIDLNFCMGKKNRILINGTAHEIEYKLKNHVQAPNDLYKDKNYYEYVPVKAKRDLPEGAKNLRVIVVQEQVKD